MKKNKLAEIVSFPLSLVFIYVGFSKYFNLDLFIHAMGSQPFPRWMAAFLIYTLPASEILTGFLLLFSRTRKAGLYAAGILIISFTIYAWAVLLHLFSSHSPCPCGGMISTFSWKQHAFFNSFLLLVIVLCLVPVIDKIKKFSIRVYYSYIR